MSEKFLTGFGVGSWWGTGFTTLVFGISLSSPFVIIVGIIELVYAVWRFVQNVKKESSK